MMFFDFLDCRFVQANQEATASPLRMKIPLLLWLVALAAVCMSVSVSSERANNTVAVRNATSVGWPRVKRMDKLLAECATAFMTEFCKNFGAKLGEAAGEKIISAMQNCRGGGQGGGKTSGKKGKKCPKKRGKKRGTKLGKRRSERLRKLFLARKFGNKRGKKKAA